ncbi:patatin-like protein 6 [Senna tora]|uniref:Patatin-like protein 6 n=1 Tax=Senna tora TaxID=362788 RepID=A0A834XAB1_9FABA|nr:patatin-like protein 6 [Senna tora]
MGRCGPNDDTDSSGRNEKMLIGKAKEMLKHNNVESMLIEGKRIGN